MSAEAAQAASMASNKKLDSALARVARWHKGGSRPKQLDAEGRRTCSLRARGEERLPMDGSIPAPNARTCPPGRKRAIGVCAPRSNSSPTASCPKSGPDGCDRRARHAGLDRRHRRTRRQHPFALLPGLGSPGPSWRLPVLSEPGFTIDLVSALNPRTGPASMMARSISPGSVTCLSDGT